MTVKSMVKTIRGDLWEEANSLVIRHRAVCHACVEMGSTPIGSTQQPLVRVRSPHRRETTAQHGEML